MIQRGSPIFNGRFLDVDAATVARMKLAGAIILAKANLPSFLTGRSDSLMIKRAIAGEVLIRRRRRTQR